MAVSFLIAAQLRGRRPFGSARVSRPFTSAPVLIATIASATIPAMTASHKAICCWGLAGATAAGRDGEDLVAGQTHQAMTAIASAIAPTAAIATGAIRARRDPTPDTLVAGSSTTASGRKVKIRTDRAIFLTLCSPLSSNGYGSLSLIWSRTTREMQIPPGSASASRRAATLTLSPKCRLLPLLHLRG